MEFKPSKEEIQAILAEMESFSGRFQQDEENASLATPTEKEEARFVLDRIFEQFGQDILRTFSTLDKKRLHETLTQREREDLHLLQHLLLSRIDVEGRGVLNQERRKCLYLSPSRIFSGYFLAW